MAICSQVSNKLLKGSETTGGVGFLLNFYFGKASAKSFQIALESEAI
jgi:hypothetical protein